MGVGELVVFLAGGIVEFDADFDDAGVGVGEVLAEDFLADFLDSAAEFAVDRSTFDLDFLTELDPLAIAFVDFDDRGHFAGLAEVYDAFCGDLFARSGVDAQFVQRIHESSLATPLTIVCEKFTEPLACQALSFYLYHSRNN